MTSSDDDILWAMQRLMEQEGHEQRVRSAEFLRKLADERGGEWVRRAEEAEAVAQPRQVFNMRTQKWELLEDVRDEQERRYREKLEREMREGDPGDAQGLL